MNQDELFDVGERVVYPRHATPEAPGSGPEGETCGTCANVARVEYHGKIYRKCGVMRPHWTHGEGTDIRMRWPACGNYKAHQ